MKFLKTLSVLLCFALLLSSCGGGAGMREGKQDIKDKEPKGRYLEQKTDFPKLTGVITMDEVAPDTYYLLGTQNGCELPYTVWCSEDGAKTWQQKEYAGLSELDITAAAFLPDGSFYANYIADQSDPDNFKCKTVLIDKNGLTAIEGIPVLDTFIQGLTLTQAGELLFNNGLTLTVADLADKTVTASYEAESMFWSGSYCAFDSSLAVSGNEAIALYDTATGERSGAIPYAVAGGVGSSDGSRVLAVQRDRSGIFYCDRSGLYRVAMDGSITEWLIDGALTTFGLPSVTLQGLFQASDGSFLTLYQGGSAFELQRFVYDENASLVPGQGLTLVSLREDPFIRQAIGLYQRDNPNITINYRVEMTDENGVTASDARRTLAAELLAGDGADILVLDGLPIDSYIQKGVLADLGEAVGSELGNLLPNVTAKTGSAGELFAVPTRISAPILAGIDIDEIHSLKNFADYLEKKENSRTGIVPETLMESFYPTCAVRWFGEDGKLNTDNLREDLTALKRIAELSKENIDNLYISSQALYFGGGGLALIYGQLGELENLTYIFSALEKRGGGTVKPFPDEAGSALVLSGILGVNAAGKNADAAKDFVRFALGQEAQQGSFDSGMPVRLSALQAITESREADSYYSGANTTNRKTGESYELETLWFTKEQAGEAIELLKAAKTSVYIDEIVRDAVMEETAKLFADQQTAEITADALERFIERYWQEKW